jgi:hypothetical protein
MDTTSNTLSLSTTFQNYMPDFASSIKGLPFSILEWLPSKDRTHIDESAASTKKLKVEFFQNVKNEGWHEYAGDHYVFESTPKADYKAVISTKKMAVPERKEIKKQGSLRSLFRLEIPAES